MRKELFLVLLFLFAGCVTSNLQKIQKELPPYIKVSGIKVSGDVIEIRVKYMSPEIKDVIEDVIPVAAVTLKHYPDAEKIRVVLEPKNMGTFGFEIKAADLMAYYDNRINVEELLKRTKVFFLDDGPEMSPAVTSAVFLSCPKNAKVNQSFYVNLSITNPYEAVEYGRNITIWLYFPHYVEVEEIKKSIELFVEQGYAHNHMVKKYLRLVIPKVNESQLVNLAAIKVRVPMDSFAGFEVFEASYFSVRENRSFPYMKLDACAVKVGEPEEEKKNTAFSIGLIALLAIFAYLLLSRRK